MKVMKTVDIPLKPARTEEVVSHALCDLCGTHGKPEYDGDADALVRKPGREAH